MSQPIRLPIALCLALAATGCATTPASAPLTAGTEASIEGSVLSINTQPLAYDGNAVIFVETMDRQRVSVQLPARWNLCKAPAVDVNALTVGSRVRVTGTVGEEGEIVVCQKETHRLLPVEM